MKKLFFCLIPLLFALPEYSVHADDTSRVDYPRNVVSVSSPPYCSDISGDTTLAIVAPGLTKATVRCWKQGDGGGSDSVVGDVQLDDKGIGTIVFPVDDYPHGPLTIRITGANGSTTDTCHLQVYNKGGVSWNEGIPSDLPPAAEGMSLVFQDDFKSMPSISDKDPKATYYDHKTGGGDFGMFHFVGPESGTNPFSQVDTYLRIHADAKTRTDGIISSLRSDGTGFTAALPSYFECRFLSQTAPGTWPAFWIMSKDAYKGLSAPADELDIIEGYGGEGRGNPNNNGYVATAHYWNQGDEGNKQPGIYKFIKLSDAGLKGGVYDTFHTYGCKITDTDTIYYCDNVEVGRHKTAMMSKKEPFFFMINLAVGGNGWPENLSRYAGLADMYVDYVRVFSGAGKDSGAANSDLNIPTDNP